MICYFLGSAGWGGETIRITQAARDRCKLSYFNRSDYLLINSLNFFYLFLMFTSFCMQGEAGGLSKLFGGDNADLVDNKFTLEVPHPKAHPIYATGKTCNAILLYIQSVGKKFKQKKKKGGSFCKSA